MDSAVWGMQTVVDRRRQEREAEATAHRQARPTARTSEAGPARPSRWQRRFQPAVVAGPERAGDDLELVGAGEPR